MLSVENLAGIESEGRRLGLVARQGPNRPVPQYPGWTLEDLASHTASIHARTTLICRDCPTERISAPRCPVDVDPIDWYEKTLDEMLTTLSEVDPATPVWGFGPEPNIGFWERRMVIETGVHRWDAYHALDMEDRLTDLTARSGLDEFATMWLPHLGQVPTLSVTATDLDVTWIYGAGDPEVSVEGSASDLYLRLVSRPSPVSLPQAWATAVDAMAPPPKR